MPQKRKKQAGALGVKDLWIAPRSSLKGPAGERAWDHRLSGIPNSARFLELADIALGNKEPGVPKKKRQPSETHELDKKEPCSRS